jgi:hypothetical protein
LPGGGWALLELTDALKDCKYSVSIIEGKEFDQARKCLEIKLIKIFIVKSQ